MATERSIPPVPMPDLDTIRMAVRVRGLITGSSVEDPEVTEFAARAFASGDTSVYPVSREKSIRDAVKLRGDRLLAEISWIATEVVYSPPAKFHETFWRFYHVSTALMRERGLTEWESLFGIDEVRKECRRRYQSPSEAVEELGQTLRLTYLCAIPMTAMRFGVFNQENPFNTKVLPQGSVEGMDEIITDMAVSLSRWFKPIVYEIWGEDGYKAVKSMLTTQWLLQYAQQPISAMPTDGENETG